MKTMGVSGLILPRKLIKTLDFKRRIWNITKEITEYSSNNKHGCFFSCCMIHSASHAPMDFAIGGGYVQPHRSPREATIRWAFMPPDVSQGRGERRGLPIDAGRGRGREFEESLGQGALRRDG